MTQKQSILYDHLQHNNYRPQTIFYKSRLKNPFGWFALMETGETFYLGRTVDSACYLIEWKQIKPVNNEKKK